MSSPYRKLEQKKCDFIQFLPYFLNLKRAICIILRDFAMSGVQETLLGERDLPLLLGVYGFDVSWV